MLSSPVNITAQGIFFAPFAAATEVRLVADLPRIRYNGYATTDYDYRDVAQPGSALPWGGRGPGFKSRHSDQNGPARTRWSISCESAIYR